MSNVEWQHHKNYCHRGEKSWLGTDGNGKTDSIIREFAGRCSPAIESLAVERLPEP